MIKSDVNFKVTLRGAIHDASFKVTCAKLSSSLGFNRATGGNYLLAHFKGNCESLIYVISVASHIRMHGSTTLRYTTDSNLKFYGVHATS